MESQHEEEGSIHYHHSGGSSSRTSRHHATPTKEKPHRVIPIHTLLILFLLVNLAMSMHQLPLNKTIEQRLCREYYDRADPSVIDDGSGGGRHVPEELCKVDEVQQGLGRIQGGMEGIWIFGDFIMTIPLSFVAEKHGTRPVLWLNMISRIFMLSWAVAVGYLDELLPTRAILLGSGLSWLGGDCVFASITYFLASGISEDRVVTSSYFGYMSSLSYVVAFIGPSLAAASMSTALWIPFVIGVFLLCIAVFVIWLIPRHHIHDRTHRTPSSFHQHHNQPLLSSSSSPSSPILKAQNLHPTTASSLLPALSSRLRTLRNILTSHPQNFTLLLLSFFLTSLASSDTKLLPQYIAKRYAGWTFASAGYLLTGKGVINFTLLTVVVPWGLRKRCEQRQRRRTGDGRREDDKETKREEDRDALRFAQLCLLLSVAGAGLISISWMIGMLFLALVVYALGSALPVFTLSLLKSDAVKPSSGADAGSVQEREGEGEMLWDGAVEEMDGSERGVVRTGEGSHEDSEPHIFSIVMLTRAMGSLLGAPLMALLWVKGIELGGQGGGYWGLGLPYVVSATCYGIAMGVMVAMRF